MSCWLAPKLLWAEAVAHAGSPTGELILGCKGLVSVSWLQEAGHRWGDDELYNVDYMLNEISGLFLHLWPSLQEGQPHQLIN